MADEDLTVEDGPRLAEPPSEVPDFTVRIGKDGWVFGQSRTGDEAPAGPEGWKGRAYPDYRPNPDIKATDFVISPEEFRQGYRLTGSLGPPMDITLTEMAHSQVEEVVDYIDEFDPTLAMRLTKSPELMFTVPEIAISVDEALVERFGGSRGAAANRLMEALAFEDGSVFQAESLVQVLRSTEGTAEFWSEWGEFFVPEERNIVATLLANVPTRWRDRSAGLAYRYLQENRNEIATSQEAMNEFILWLWNESKKQSESGEFSGSVLGKFGDIVSTPYYAVQEGVGRLYANIVAPEDQAWRGALTPGQTLAISMGLDPSDSKWTETTAAIDLVGNFVLDPINIATGVGFGLKAARAIPLAADAAQTTRGARALKGVIPIFGRRTAENLPIGNRSAWQRLGYHLFAKDVEGLTKTTKYSNLTKTIARHVASGKGPTELIEKFPDLKPLLGSEGGALAYIWHSDPEIVGHGLRALLEGASDNIIHVAEQVKTKYRLLDGRMRRQANKLANEGRLGTDDLMDLLDYRASEGIKVYDNPDPSVRIPLARNADETADVGKGGVVWTELPRDLDVTDQTAFPSMLDWVAAVARGEDEVIDAAGRQRVVEVVFDQRTGEIAISSRRATADIIADLAEAGPSNPYESIATDISPEGLADMAARRVQERVISEVGQDQPFFRSVRILVDPDDPIWSLPEEIRMSMWDALTERAIGADVADSMVASEIREILRNVVKTGQVDEAKAASLNAQSGLPILYGGFGPSFGGEARAKRVGQATGKRYARTDTVRPGFAGEGPVDITEGAPFLFPNSTYASSDPTLAVAFDDLGNPIRESGLNTPIELVTWTDTKRPPVLIDLDESHDYVRTIVREEIAKFNQAQEIDIFGEDMVTYLRAQMGDIDDTLEDAYARQADEYFAAFSQAEESRLGRQLSADEADELRMKADDIVRNEMVLDRLRIKAEQDFIESYRAKNDGRSPSALEMSNFHAGLAATAASEMTSAERVAEQYPGARMAFETADDYFRDIYNLPGWEALERVDDTTIRGNYLVQADIDRLVQAAEEGGYSDLQLLYQLRQTMESGGFSGKRINQVVRRIEKRIMGESGADGFYYGRGNKRTPTTVNKREEIQFRQAARDRARQRRQEIQAKYVGPRGGPRIISGGQTGVDRWALEEAQKAKLATGGTAPRGWKTDVGPDETLADFGLKQHGSAGYPPRTMENVDQANMTIAFHREGSVGTGRTIGYAQTGKWTDADIDRLMPIPSTGERPYPIYVDMQPDEGYHKPVTVISIKQLRDLTDDELDEVGRTLADVIAPDLEALNWAGPRAKSLQGDDERRIRRVMNKAMEAMRGEADERLADSGALPINPGDFNIRNLSAGQRTAYLEELKHSQAIYEREIANIRKSKRLEDKIIGFFPKKHYGRVRTGVRNTENYIETVVPSNEAGARLMGKLGGQYFLDLPPKAQAQLLEELPRTQFGTPIKGEIPSQLRPRELPSGAIDPATLRAENVRSLDFPTGEEGRPLGDILGPDSASPVTMGDTGDELLQAPPAPAPRGRRPTPPGERLELRGEMPPVPSPGEQAAMAAPREVPGQARLGLEYPNLTTEELEILRRYADATGYDRVKLPGDYELITKRGQQKTRSVRIGPSDADLTELRTLQSKLARADMDLKWAEAVVDNEIIGLKQLPTSSRGILRRIIPDGMISNSDADGFIANWARRFTAGWDASVGSIPEGVNIFDTNQGYKELRSFLRLLGVGGSDMNRHLDAFIEAPVAARYGVLQDIVRQVAAEIDHPLLRVRLQDWAASGGVQSYAPYFDELGNETERGLRLASSGDGVVTAPLLPSQLSNVYPLPGRDFYTMLTRYRRGQLLGNRVVGMLSTMGGSKKARLANGKKILSALERAGIDDFDMEEALLFGYANIASPETAGYLTKAVRQLKGAKIWNLAQRGFTRVQLAARPFTWFARVVLFDESARGALFDLPSMYKHPFAWMGAVADNYRITRVGLYRRQLVESVNAEMASLFRGVNSVDEALARADSIVPGLASRVDGELTTVAQVKNAVYRMIDLDAEDVLGEFGDNFARNVQRHRKAAARANKTLSKYHLPADFLWDDVPEIAQKGLVSDLLRDAESTFRPMRWNPQMMNKTERQAYGRAYGSAAHQFASDRWGRIALEELASRSAGATSDGHIRLVNSANWAHMRSNIAQQAEFAGFDFQTEAELARWYLHERLIPQAEYLFGPVLGDDVRNGLLKLVNGKLEARVGDDVREIRFSRSNSAAWVDEFEQLVLDNSDHAFPGVVAGHFNPMHRLGDQDSGINKLANKIIDVAGERATQTLNRRPAWLKEFKREYEYLIARGFDETLARRIAESEATRKINHVYFNMKDVPHYVERLNKVIPFFSAMYEVTGSWAFKLPMAQSALGWPDGMAMLGRKVDRFINGMIWSGLLEVDDEADEGSPTGTRQLSLVLSHQLPTNNELAAKASSYARGVMGAFETITRTLLGYNSTLKEIDPDLFDWIDYRIGVGNPIDPFSHGIGAALQVSAGLNPLGSFALGTIRNKSFWAGDNRTFEAKAGTTLGEFAEEMDVTVQELMVWNEDLFEKLNVFSQYELNAMRRGLIDASLAELPRDLALRVPKSTLFGEIMDQVWFPFDQVESGMGVLHGYLPSWSNFFFRGLGLHSAVGESSPYTVTDSGRIMFEGEDGTITEFSNWFTNFMLPPETRVFMAGDITMALQHLEATEGVISHYFTLTARYEEAKKAAVDAGLKLIEGDNGLEVLNGDDPRYRELEEEVLTLRSRIDDHSSMIIKRATEVAAHTSMVRGIAGLFGPANPRSVYREAEKRALYYESRDAVEHARIVGGELKGVQLPEVSGVKDVESFFTLANMWFEDMSGDGPQRWFRENYPLVAPFLKGKTYWGPGGESVRSQSYDDYVDRVRDGLEKPYTPEIATLIQLKTAMDIEREAAIVEAYGNDPIEAAVAIINDFHNYRENIQAPYEMQRTYIDIIDDQMGNPWEEFAERTKDNFPLLVDDIYDVFNDAYKDINLATEALATNADELTSAELIQTAEDLEAAAKGLDRVRDQFNLYFINDDRVGNPREELITQYFAEVLRPYYEKEAEFRRRAAEPGLSSEDRQRIFTEQRQWENEILNDPTYLIGPNGERFEVPNRLEYRTISSSPETDRGYTLRNLNGNPAWNNLYENRKLVEEFPQLGGLLPVTQQEAQLFDNYDILRLAVDQEVEAGRLTESDGQKVKRQYREDIQTTLEAQGKGDQAYYMLEATPAERMRLAGILDENYPYLQNTAANVRYIMDQMDALGEARTGQLANKAYAAMLEDFKVKWLTDPVFNERVIALADQLGIAPYADTFFGQFFLGMFNGDF